MRKYTRRDNIWIPKSAQNFFVPISENPVNSYDSNGGILVFISALGNEKQKLPFSLFTCSFSGSPGRIRTYYMTLERYFKREDSAVKIVGNGSVGTEFCQGLWKKGDQVLYWNSVLEYRVTQVMIRPSLISSISPLPQYGFRPNLISTESYVQGKSNGVGCKEFG